MEARLYLFAASPRHRAPLPVANVSRRRPVAYEEAREDGLGEILGFCSEHPGHDRGSFEGPSEHPGGSHRERCGALGLQQQLPAVASDRERGRRTGRESWAARASLQQPIVPPQLQPAADSGTRDLERLGGPVSFVSGAAHRPASAFRRKISRIRVGVPAYKSGPGRRWEGVLRVTWRE